MNNCILCNGKLIEETESDISDYTCEDCDCLQDGEGNIFSDIPFFLANYGTEKNIEIFQDFNEAKKESLNYEVYQADLNHSNVWYEENIGWCYEDKSSLFLSSPKEINEEVA